MFSTAIVIFREALEISVIISAVLAATRGLPHRSLWIAGGFGGGVLGAGLVAAFVQTISQAVEGVGQELFNAAVLFTAVLFIGWTVLWMRRHAREMTHHLKQVGHDVAQGKTPLYTLSLIIALVMLREGSEIVLFVYGMTFSGQSIVSIALGCVIGLLLGTGIGIMLYFGLIRASTKYMFGVTSWVLILLVAGLAAQGAGFLSAAGYFSAYSAPVWDTSWLLSEDSVLGQTLHSLIGYSAQPSMIQLGFYLLTLGTIITIMRISDSRGASPVPSGAAHNA